MTVYSHYAVAVLANTYLIAPPQQDECILIDPQALDVPLLELIERNGFTIRHLLFTHPSHSRAHGIRTIRKVYDVELYVPHGGSPAYRSNYVSADDELELGGAAVRVLSAQDDEAQGVLYDIEGTLFSGVWLSAGVVATEAPQHTRVTFKHRLVETLTGYPDRTPILPFRGPPTTLGVERRSSPAFTDYSLS